MTYIVKYVKEDVPVITFKKNELLLRDLLAVLPTFKKNNHKLEVEIHKDIKRLRNGRRQKHFTLEVSRKFPSYNAEGKIVNEIKVSKLLTKGLNKVNALKELKSSIITQIQDIRKKQKPPIEDFDFHEGVKVKKLEMCYLEPNTFVKLAHRRVRTKMQSAKQPSGTDRYIGVEIELSAKENREQVCDALFEAGVGKYIHVKHDGSITVSTEYPHEHEITVLVKESEYRDIINKICKCLNEVLHCKVDKSCGLHVHLDMRHRDPAIPYSNLVTMQNYLYAMCPANRKNSKYSIPMKSKTWKISSNHYDGISSNAYQKYKTIELRMHGGTIQAKKINSWIALLTGIVNAPLITSTPKTIKEAGSLLNLSSDVVTYVEGRIAKFADQHKKLKKNELSAHLEDVEPVAMALPDASDVEEQSEVA